MLFYTAKDFNSEFKINLVMVLICLTNFRSRSRSKPNIDINESDSALYKRLSFVYDDRLFNESIDFETFILRQEISSLISNGLNFTKEKTTSVAEGAMISMKYIVKLWESKSKLRKLYLSDFIRGINIDMPNPDA